MDTALNWIVSGLLFYLFAHFALRRVGRHSPLYLLIHGLIALYAGIKFLSIARRSGFSTAAAYFESTLASTRAGFLSFT